VIDKNAMKQGVILLGKGTLAIRIAEWFLENPNYELRVVVPVIPEPAWTDSLSAWAERHDVPLVPSGHYKDVPDVLTAAWQTDLALSVFYDKIIKEWFIAKCKTILNLHNSPLPKYRGVSPINWALKNGEQQHGVTIHEITPGIDDGPIYSQLLYSIYPAVDEVRDVYARALEYGWTLFTQTMPLLGKIKPAAQDHAQATYYNAKQNSLLAERRSFTREESVASANGHHQ
jgi:methionyl-tRNA formyltransferase